MLDRVRGQLTGLLALAVAIAALVLALGGRTNTTLVAGDATNASGPVTVLDVKPKGAEEIAIVDFTYDPDPVRVQVGQAVAWTNEDGAMHTVTAKDGTWGSEMLMTGDTVVMTFAEPGVYEYICALHPPHLSVPPHAPGAKLVGGGGRPMQGTIIVE